MEMTEGIYRPVDPGEVSRPTTDKYEEAGTDTIDVLSKNPNSRDNQEGPGPHHSGPWKSTAVLGLLCVLLLSGIAVLSFKMMETKQLQAREKLQLQESYDTLSREKFQLQTSYNNLNSQKDKLQDRFNNLNSEKSKLQDRFNNLNREKSQLQTSYNNLNSDKSQLQTRYNNLTREKTQLQDRLNTVTAERDALQEKFTNLQSMLEIKSYAVDVSLDPDTAYPGLILSADGKQMRFEDVLQDLPKNTERFDSVSCAMGKEGFSSGKFYFEVEVTGMTDADLGVASHSVDRKGEITVSPEDGFWELWLRNGTEYEAILNDKNLRLSLEEAPQVVGLFVDYEAGLVSFYDADTWHHIYSFTSASFTTEIHPSLCINAFNETLAFKTKCH